MPTTTRTLSVEDQERERHRAASLPVPLTVWECETPAELPQAERAGGLYALDGDGLRLFGSTDYFDPDLPLEAADDADAVSKAKTMIFDRWVAERDRMLAAFWPPAEGEPWRAAEAPDVDSDNDLDADLTVDLDEPRAGRADTPAEAAALE